MVLKQISSPVLVMVNTYKDSEFPYNKVVYSDFKSLIALNLILPELISLKNPLVI